MKEKIYLSKVVPINEGKSVIISVIPPTRVTIGGTETFAGLEDNYILSKEKWETLQSVCDIVLEPRLEFSLQDDVRCLYRSIKNIWKKG
jgi:hypothetical protein